MSAESAFEYIDHPADIQIHSWGPSFQRALEPLCVGLFGVMMDPAGFHETTQKSLSVSGKDILSLVYAFLGEWLFVFDTEAFVLLRIDVTKVDIKAFTIEATAYGDTFDMAKHEDFRRTEVKAITYASMKVDIHDDKAEIYVIVDL
jgi:SHS2 domain-containing protein